MIAMLLGVASVVLVVLVACQQLKTEEARRRGWAWGCRNLLRLLCRTVLWRLGWGWLVGEMMACACPIMCRCDWRREHACAVIARDVTTHGWGAGIHTSDSAQACGSGRCA